MQQQNFWKNSAILPAILASVLIMLAASFPAAAQKTDKEAETQNANGVESGYVSVLIGLLRGQYVKVSAVNQDNQDIPVKFVLVDDKGKVLIQCNEIVDAGKSVSAVFQHPGGVNRLEFYAQIRTNKEKDLKNLIPSVQIIDVQTDRTELILGGSDFFSFRPIFNPPLVEFGGIQ